MCKPENLRIIQFTITLLLTLLLFKIRLRQNQYQNNYKRVYSLQLKNKKLFRD